jgi:hypothetical protein
MRRRRDGEGLDPGPDQDPAGAALELRGSRRLQHHVPARCSCQHPRGVEAGEHFGLHGVWSACVGCILQNHAAARHRPHRIVAAEFRRLPVRNHHATSAKYVAFHCFDDYYGSIDMATALHPQTILATKYAKEYLGDPFGFPLRLRTATKLGFKNPKWITTIEVTNNYPGGFWEDRGFNWFSGM